MATGKIELSVGYTGGFDEELNERVDTIEGKIEEINSSLDNKADKELNERVEVIEGEIEEINSSLDNKANEDHTHEPQVNCDTVDNLHFICLTKSEYDALETKDSNTLYFIKKEVE